MATVRTAGDFLSPLALNFVLRQGPLGLIQAAQELGGDISAVVERQAKCFFENLARLSAHW